MQSGIILALTAPAYVSLIWRLPIMRDPIEQLHRIQNAIIKITEYAKKGRRKFDSEEEIQLSVIYYLQTISDAANTIPLNFKDHHPEIPWKQLADFHSLITHYY